jgi:hypothetical protein
MKIIRKQPNTSGSYPAPQTWNSNIPPSGYAFISDTVDTEDFYSHNGFVTLIINGDTVTGYTVNVAAWEEWKANLPDPAENEPTEEEDTSAMLIDHEYRLTLLELGLSEY